MLGPSSGKTAPEKRTPRTDFPPGACAACSLLVLHCGDFVYPVRSSRSSLLYTLFGLFELISLIIFVPFFLCSLSGASAMAVKLTPAKDDDDNDENDVRICNALNLY